MGVVKVEVEVKGRMESSRSFAYGKKSKLQSTRAKSSSSPLSLLIALHTRCSLNGRQDLSQTQVPNLQSTQVISPASWSQNEIIVNHQLLGLANVNSSSLLCLVAEPPPSSASNPLLRSIKFKMVSNYASVAFKYASANNWTGWWSQSSVSNLFPRPDPRPSRCPESVPSALLTAAYSYPKHVWSPAGGWYAQPSNWKVNTAVFGAVIVGLVGLTWNLSANREFRHTMPRPDRFYPSRK